MGAKAVETEEFVVAVEGDYERTGRQWTREYVKAIEGTPIASLLSNLPVDYVQVRERPDGKLEAYYLRPVDPKSIDREIAAALLWPPMKQWHQARAAEETSANDELEQAMAAARRAYNDRLLAWERANPRPT